MGIAAGEGDAKFLVTNGGQFFDAFGDACMCWMAKANPHFVFIGTFINGPLGPGVDFDPLGQSGRQ